MLPAVRGCRGRMREWVTTRPRDLPVGGLRCALRWGKCRWCCDQRPVRGRRSPSRCSRFLRAISNARGGPRDLTHPSAEYSPSIRETR